MTCVRAPSTTTGGHSVNRIFRSDFGRSQIHAIYDEAVGAWPVSVESRFVETRHGRAHLLEWGRTNAPTLIALHGQGDAAIAWRHAARALGQRFRVIAPDIPGEPGKSVAARPPRDNPFYIEWLTDLMGAVNVRDACILGVSFGGFLALRAAIERAECVRRLVLIAPAGIVPIRLPFALRMLPLLFSPTPTNCRQVLRRISAPGTRIDPLDVRWVRAVLRYFRSATHLPILATGRLRRVQAPTLPILGEVDPFFRMRALARRTRDHLPGFERVEIVAHAGHNVPAEQPGVVADLIGQFCGG